MYHDLLEAYRKAEKATSSPRETEARVLTLAARKLVNCREQWESGERKSLLMEALKYNQKIWSVFQADLIGSDNPIPLSLRVNLLRLAAYVDKQIFAIMAKPSPEKLTPIININMGLASGLRGKQTPIPSGTNENVPDEKS
jgi:flagellar protein FlaF